MADTDLNKAGGAIPADEANPASEAGLEALRRQIDETDRQLLALVNRRAELAGQVGEVKQHSDAPVYRPEREAQIMRRLREANPGPLPGEAIEAIWREIVSGCRELERRLRVAFLGPVGTFSEQALLQQFGSGVDGLACPSIDEVFRAAEAGTADFGVVPVENSTEGAVNRTLDLFLQSPLEVSGEISIRIEQNLMTRSGSMQGVQRIVSHAQSLAQCAGWLQRNHPELQRVPVASNAEAARLASLDDETAAIAGHNAALRWGVQIVANNIQDEPNNRTRFAVVGHYRSASSGDDQTSLILSVPDRAGAVHALIEPLARHGVSMKRFESRPARQAGWEYIFYVDIIGHRDDENVATALAELRERAVFFKVVGSYPRATG